MALIYRITLTSRSGVIRADIPNTHIFGSLVSKVNTKMQDLLTRNTTSYVLPAGATTDNLTAGQDATSQLGALTAAQATPYADIVRCNHLTNYQLSEKPTINLALLTATAYTPYLEPINLFSVPALAQYNAVSYQINLSAFKDTLME